MITKHVVAGASEVDAEWLDEHLAFAVPLRMFDLDRRARRGVSVGFDYLYALKSAVDFDSERIKLFYGMTQKRFDIETNTEIGTELLSSSLTMLIAVHGDAILHGESGAGKAAAAVEALTTMLAYAALTQTDGITFRGNWWGRGRARTETS